ISSKYLPKQDYTWSKLFSLYARKSFHPKASRLKIQYMEEKYQSKSNKYDGMINILKCKYIRGSSSEPKQDHKVLTRTRSSSVDTIVEHARPPPNSETLHMNPLYNPAQNKG